MHSYYHYNALDFALDEYFQQWATSPSAENNMYWENFLKKHPEKTDAVTEGKSLLNLLVFTRTPAANSLDTDKVMNNIWATIQTKKQDETKEAMYIDDSLQLKHMPLDHLVVILLGALFMLPLYIYLILKSNP